MHSRDAVEALERLDLPEASEVVEGPVRGQAALLAALHDVFSFFGSGAERKDAANGV